MKAFLEPLGELQEVEEAIKKLKAAKGIIQVSGCMDAQKPHMIYAANDDFKNKIIVTFSEQKARELYEDYHFFDKQILNFPAKDLLFYQSDIRGNLLTKERIRMLKKLAECEPITLVTTYDALMNRMSEPENFMSAIKKWRVGEVLEIDTVQKELAQMGYTKNYQVEAAGEFAVRGGILDVFSLTEDYPFRIELWGDEIDSIRSFDAESQRSMENLDEVTIYPASEFVLTDAARDRGLKRLKAESKAIEKKFREEMRTEEAHRVKTNFEALAEEIEELGGSANIDSSIPYFWEKSVSLLDCFDTEETAIILDEPIRIVEKGRVTEQEFSESMKQRLEKGYILPGQMEALYLSKEIEARLGRMHCIALATLDIKVSELDISEHYNISVKSVNAYNNSFELLVKDLKQYKKNGYRVIVLSGSRTRAEHLAKDFEEEGLNSFYSEDYNHLVKPGEIMTAYGKVKRGYEYPLIKFVVISE